MSDQIDQPEDCATSLQDSLDKNSTDTDETLTTPVIVEPVDEHLESNKSEPALVHKEPAPGEPNYYIAIGASAGGLEALQLFFQHMPADSGASIIIIQHLSPDFKSVMDELLRRETKMAIYNASDDMLVEPNSIYLIPPRKNMMIAEGRLILVDQMPEKGINFPIDIFFRSLAEDKHHRSISIILSGTGSDGSRGIQAIKEVGGLVIVQEPSSAKFDGMPYSAVNTGFADVVLDVVDIPNKLISYMTHPMINIQDKSLVHQVESNDVALTEIFRLLNEQCKIDFAAYKTATVARRIERRIGINQLESLQSYLELLIKNPDELQYLAKDMLIGVTRFFRDPEYFAELEKRVIPEILKQIPISEQIRVWIAGCSTGEEAYSIAILFAEAFEALKESRSVKIFATDVDPNAINEASTGHFNLNVSEDISESRLHKFFSREDDAFVIAPKIRQMIVFATHNLIKDPPFSNTHLSVCRNVLIYFQPKSQRQVLSMLHFSLRQNGFLFLGSSESLGELSTYFDSVHERSRIFKKVVNASLLNRNEQPTELRPLSASPPPLESLLNSYHKRTKIQVNTVILDTLLEHYVPPCILISSEHEVMHIFGDVSAYTCKPKSGTFSAEIRDMVSRELVVPISTALHRSKMTESTIRYEAVRLENRFDEETTINLNIFYIKNSNISKECYLIVFEPNLTTHSSDSEEVSGEVIPYNADDQYQQRIRDLENQLKNKQEHLQVTVEELETTNEELQSSNEELLAANEELQSTNEELQSVNEELYTVNSEYHEKIEELTQATSDIDNIMKSTDMGIIFLDDALLIRKFTPAATKEFNLLHTDLNRPFHHISNNLIYDQLLNDIARCVDTRSMIQKEVYTIDNRLIQIKISPYISNHEQACGVVIVINDISALRSLEDKLSDGYHTLRTSIGLHLLDRTIVRILIVDDTAAHRAMIQRMLNKSNNAPFYEFEETSSITTAMSLLDRQKFDICFIDNRLGQSTALEALSALTEEERTALPPMIVISEFMDADLHKETLTLGVYDAIDKKDLSTFALDRCIRYTMQLKRMEAALNGSNRPSALSTP